MKNMKITLRLMAAFSIMVLLAAAIGLVGIRQANSIWGKVDDIFQHPLKVSNAVRDIQTQITAIHKTMKDVVLSESKEELQEYRLLIEELDAAVYSDFEILFERFLGDLSDIEVAYNAFAAWLPIREEVIDLYLEGRKSEAAAVTKGRDADHVVFMTEKMNLMAEFADQKSIDFYQEALASRNRLMLGSISLLILTIFAAVVIGYLIFFSTIKPLIAMRDRLQKLLVENKEQADKIIRINEHRFNVAVENSPFPVMMHADDGEVLMLSRSWESITGYGLQDIPTITDWVRKAYPENSDEMQEYIYRIFTSKKVDVNKDVTIRCNDGSSRIWTFNTASLGSDITGRKVLMSMAVDVTREKLAEQILEAEKEKLSVTLRSIGDGVITTDVQGRIQLMNRVAEQLTGWNQADAAGRELEEVFNIIHEDTRKKHLNPVEKVITTGEIIELENHTLLIARDGTERVIADSGAPIRNRESEVIGVVLVFRDQTDARKYQVRMQRSEKLESLGVLAGGLAHDFNNLLGGLFGYIELANEASSEETVKTFLSSAMDVFDRAKGITMQLLTFAKGGEPIRKSLQIDKLVMKNASFILSGTDIAISYHVEGNLWLSHVDENQIGQVVDNLIINARQAMPDGGTITVNMKNVELIERNSSRLKPGKYVAVSFEDTGKGIPKEYLGKIFDPFFSTKAHGNGLGLATCYSIIQRHDGIIDVSTVHGKGSTFTMYLPKAETDSDKEISTNTISHSGSGLILVLDDERHMRDIVRRMAEDMGYSVLTAGDGDKAIQITKESLSAGKLISAALLDLTIPGGLGGFEILEEIKKMFPECIIFATSGYSNNPIMADPILYGFHDSLHKPYKKQELQALFSKHFDNSAV